MPLEALMKKQLGVAILLPVFNEEEIIEKNVAIVMEACQKLPYRYSLYLIDYGSTDGTSQRCQEACRRYSPLFKYFRYENGPSRRENLAKSFALATEEIIVFMDTDLSVHPDNLPALLHPLTEGYDVVTGSRYVGITSKRKFRRLMISKTYNFFLQTYFKSAINDHQCGFKAFKREKVLPLLQLMGYDTSLTRGWFWDAELFLRAQQAQCRIKEIPVEWTDIQKSSFRWRRELQMLRYIFTHRKEL
jgi:hypothetical protein